MIVRTITKSDSIEKDNLAAHVEICNHRYEVLEAKISSIETKLENLLASNEQQRNQVISMIKAAVAIISLVVSVTVIFLDKIH